MTSSKPIILINIILLLQLLIISSCNNRYNDVEYIKKSDLIDNYEFVLEPPMLDSAKTQYILDRILFNNDLSSSYYLYPQQTAHIYLRTDLAYLPYFIVLFKNQNMISHESQRYADQFVSMCTAAIDDKKLFNLGKQIIGKNDRSSRIASYPNTFSCGSIPNCYNPGLEYSLTMIDTFRVRTVAHNDREALAKLEDYYKKINDPKGIAIYYKVMLGYEGNGDLAEKFYRVLEPYFKETPQFRMAVREALLRAALCDHNARAQQLCDSLGFSLCDYRLPPIE